MLSLQPSESFRFTPTELLDNAPQWWLMLELTFEPMRIALFWAVTIALSLKLCSLGCLRLLKRYGSAGPRDAAAKKDT